MIFELGNRHLSAGFAGESCPRCRIGFGPEESRRVGDYRKWLPGYEDRPKKKRRVSTWGQDYELWRMDLREYDVGIVGDKVERAVREAYTRYLLLDSKSRKVCLILPSVLPQQVLNEILHTLFEHFQMPSITLLSPSILSTLAAGCRSGLVVDLGWEETIITAVYEYREVCQFRTLCGTKTLTRTMAMMLDQHESQRTRHPAAGHIVSSDQSENGVTSVSVEQAEDIVARMAWCRQRPSHQYNTTTATTAPPSEELASLSIKEDVGREESSKNAPTDDTPRIVSIQSPFSSRQNLQLPFSVFADITDQTFFSDQSQSRSLDDHEQPLPQPIFKCLISLPPDVRSITMSRIMFTGGGSRIPGLKPRIMEELTTLLNERGFDPVIGKAADERKRRLQEKTSANRQSQKPATADPSETPSPIPASQIPQTIDEIDEKLLRQEQEKVAKPTAASGVLRCVESLGAWAGGSLLASLRVKGIVEIEKDAFLQYGLAGAKRNSDINPLQQQQQRKSYGVEIGRSGIGERTSWTLGAWA